MQPSHRQTKNQIPHTEETHPTDFKSKNQTTQTGQPNTTSRQQHEHTILQGGLTPNTHTKHISYPQKHIRHTVNTISC